jgi:Acetyltransferase (GNAT) domain
MDTVILTPSQQLEWLGYLNRSLGFDFCHLSEYSAFAQKSGEGQPVLFVVQDCDEFIAFPFLIRDIPGADSKDVSSVYGYPGPVASATVVSEVLQVAFAERLREYLLGLNAVTLFSRLNPYLPAQEHWLCGLGEVSTLSSVVFVDLRDADFKSNFAKQLKYDIRKLASRGYRCIVDDRLVYLQDFVRIYLDTMSRNGASSYYLFDDAYFKMLFSLQGAQTKLFVCLDSVGQVAAGALFVRTGEGVQYHLSATSDQHKSDGPTKLVLDSACDYYRDLSASHINLGGGVGGEQDSLFQFKRRFSPCEADYKVLKWVIDQKKYEDLCYSLGRSSSSFFPAYRNPVLVNESEKLSQL